MSILLSRQTDKNFPGSALGLHSYRKSNPPPLSTSSALKPQSSSEIVNCGWPEPVRSAPRSLAEMSFNNGLARHETTTGPPDDLSKNWIPSTGLMTLFGVFHDSFYHLPEMPGRMCVPGIALDVPTGGRGPVPHCSASSTPILTARAWLPFATLPALTGFTAPQSQSVDEPVPATDAVRRPQMKSDAPLSRGRASAFCWNYGSATAAGRLCSIRGGFNHKTGHPAGSYLLQFPQKNCRRLLAGTWIWELVSLAAFPRSPLAVLAD